jgi:hypothetical protein
MVDIPIDAGKGLGAFEALHGSTDGDSFARRLKEVSGKYYGTALREFIKHLAEDRDGVALRVNSNIKTFTAKHCPAGCDGQIQRVASRFALAASAAEEAISWGILPWPKNEGQRAASTCFSAWLGARGGTGSAETQEGLSLVRAFIQQHGASRFEDLNADHEQKTINRAGYRRLVGGEVQYCIPPEMFRSEVCPGHNPKSILEELSRRGLLFSETGRNTLTVRTPDGKQKLHVISSRILEKPTGDTGGSGDTPELIEKIVLSPDRGQLGALGTSQPPSQSAPTCPQLGGMDRGQRNGNNPRSVPGAPTAPTRETVTAGLGSYSGMEDVCQPLEKQNQTELGAVII